MGLDNLIDPRKVKIMEGKTPEVFEAFTAFYSNQRGIIYPLNCNNVVKITIELENQGFDYV